MQGKPYAAAAYCYRKSITLESTESGHTVIPSDHERASLILFRAMLDQNPDRYTHIDWTFLPCPEELCYLNRLIGSGILPIPNYRGSVYETAKSNYEAGVYGEAVFVSFLTDTLYDYAA